MKGLLKSKRYKHGVELFIWVYLNQYQFILGSDLENYSKSNETFGKDNPCNIYFILRRPKITIDVNSILVKRKKVSLNFVIHQKDSYGVLSMGLEFKEAKGKLNITAEYPYNLFLVSDKTKPLLLARPSTLIDSNLVENNVDSEILDYEVLYIGQAFGKHGKRTALNRLASHETLQKIYTHALTNNPDSDIWIMLTNFSQSSMLLSVGADFIKSKNRDIKSEEKKEKHFFDNNGVSLTEKQKINFIEAALIKYFEPEYNSEYKNNFPSTKHKSYLECYNLDVRSLVIELDTSAMKRKIYTKSTGRKEYHMKNFEFKSDNDRLNLFNF